MTVLRVLNASSPVRISLLLATVFVVRAGHAAPPSDSPWKMTFHEEFNGQTLDTEKWLVHDSTSHDRFGYRPENVVVKDGVCRFLAKKGSYNGK